MIPNNKYQSESNSRRTSSDSKLPSKSKPTPTRERDTVENTDGNYHEEEEEEQGLRSKEDSEREEKPQIFNINYVVPSNLIIREHQTQQHTDETTENLQETRKG